MFVVDTCVLIDVLRAYLPAIEWVRDNSSKLYVPSIVILELLQPNLNDKQRRGVLKLVQAFEPKHPTDADWKRAINI